MEKTSFERIYDVVKQIPKGTVATHGKVDLQKYGWKQMTLEMMEE
jgi:alkylated DNA nucleotide flippase Atl1